MVRTLKSVKSTAMLTSMLTVTFLPCVMGAGSTLMLLITSGSVAGFPQHWYENSLPA